MAVAAVVFGACQVNTSVAVNAKADGSGSVGVTVLLDKDAATQVPDFANRLRVDDLRKAGWTVTAPLATKDGGIQVKASHPFASAAELRPVLDQLSGPTGPFRDFTITRHRSLLKTRVAFKGQVDLAKGLGSFSDPALRDRLGGSDLGFDPAELERRIGARLNQLFRFQVAVRLPGSVQSNAPVRPGNGAVWTPGLGEQVTLEASSSTLNTGNVVALVVMALAAAALVIVLALQFTRGRRPRRRPGGPAPSSFS